MTRQQNAMQSLSLDGRHVVVFGGSSGIGWATAGLAADLGAKVLVADLVAPTEAPDGLTFQRCDATDFREVEQLLRTVAATDGLHGVVTTVGGAQVASVDDLTPDLWEAELRFNLSSVYWVARAALLIMREASEGGAIVTTSSGFAWLPAPDRAAYAAAKAGVASLTRSLATVGAPYGVRVNCVAPGPTDTPRFRAMNEGDEGVARLRQRVPLGRIPEPVDVAWMNVFLLTDAAQNTTGQMLHVNGGYLMP